MGPADDYLGVARNARGRDVASLQAIKLFSCAPNC
jgi:hypothetical protein